MRCIDLDHNATTPLAPEVAEAMAACHAAAYANPASAHGAGRRARRALEDAREQIARLVGAAFDSAQSDQVIFTSGGTEANNLALLGLCAASPRPAELPAHAIISAIEHPSVVGAAAHLKRLGWRVDRLAVRRDGIIDLDQLDDSLRPETRLVSVMLGNNETGALQPIVELSARLRSRGVLLHTDAVQVAGKLAIDFRQLGADAMTITAHKLNGPVGIGALVVRHGVALQPLLHGGLQQVGLRPGTEPVALVVGLCTALQMWHRDRVETSSRMAALRDRFEDRLRAEIQIVINAASAPRLPHVSNVAFPDVDRQAMFLALDTSGVLCSTGSACASGSSEPSPTLLAMGCSPGVVNGALRFSLGRSSTFAELDEAIERILRIYRHLRGR